MMQFRLPLVLRHTKGGGRRGRQLELTAVRTCETAETTTLHGPFPHCTLQRYFYTTELRKPRELYVV